MSDEPIREDRLARDERRFRVYNLALRDIAWLLGILAFVALCGVGV